MVVLDATIANIALPYIGKDLHMSGTNLTWIVTGYALSFGGLLLLGGRLGDLYGRRKVFMTGLTVFAVASLLGGLAQNEALLLGARGLQGLGAALASPAALALITTTFPAGPARNRAFAVYAAMSGAGAAVGLILGGWLTGLDVNMFNPQDGWRLTFLINVPIGLVAALLAPRFLNESESHPGQLDVPGALAGTGGLLALVYGLTRAGNAAYGWSDGLTIASLAAGVVLLVLFFMVEFRVEHPLLPFRIFMNRTRAASFVAMMLLPAAMFSMFFFLSLFIQNVMGYSPLKAGFAFLPFSIGIIISATIVSSLVNRIDPRYIAGVGTLMASAALYGFSRLSVPGQRGGRAQRRRPRTGPRLRRQLLDPDPALRVPDGGRHGRGLRAADPHGRAPRACRGLRGRFGRAEHHAAGRRCARSRDPVDGGQPLHQQPHRQDRADGRHGACRASTRTSARR